MALCSISLDVATGILQLPFQKGHETRVEQVALISFISKWRVYIMSMIRVIFVQITVSQQSSNADQKFSHLSSYISVINSAQFLKKFSALLM